MINLTGKRIGLVLSGGGAKGAYQVGMFRALGELGLAGRIAAISGCSIGAYSAAFYAAAGPDALRGFLYEFGDFLKGNKLLDDEAVERAKREAASGGVGLEEFCAGARFCQYDTSKLRAALEKALPDGALLGVRVPLFVCAYSLEREKPVYFALSKLSAPEQRDAILASGSLPCLFPPVPLRGERYLDGGVIPGVCRSPAPQDKIPLKPLLNAGLDVILVNYLNPADRVDASGLRPGAALIELRPSAPLEERPSAGTLDFSPEKLESHERMGYRDTLCLFREGGAL